MLTSDVLQEIVRREVEFHFKAWQLRRGRRPAGLLPRFGRHGLAEGGVDDELSVDFAKTDDRDLPRLQLGDIQKSFSERTEGVRHDRDLAIDHR